MKGNKTTKAPKLSVPGAKAPAMKGGKPGKPANFNRFPPDKQTPKGSKPPAY